MDFPKLTKSTDGLLPVIVQNDLNMQVLMLGYMNEEAFKKTQETGRVTFYSRTRETLWTKGETSGNFLEVVSMALDCDQDTLLVRAIPQGPTCHKGTETCFGEAQRDSEGFIRLLSRYIQTRHKEMPEGSYTTHLFNKGVNKIAQKVGEEAVETVIEAIDGNLDRFIYESSDLIYHLLVLCEQMGVTLEDLDKELLSRHK